jgi:hypothetical protein
MYPSSRSILPWALWQVYGSRVHIVIQFRAKRCEGSKIEESAHRSYGNQ